MSNVQPLAAGESLAVGDEGEQVEELQRRLRHLGYYHGEVDGRYTDATRDAVRAYQSASGQPEDGTAGAATWERLDTDAVTAGYAGHGETGATGATTGDAAASEQLAVGTLSEDGLWQWDGAGWVAVAASSQLAVGQLSEDGQWQWNGTDWVAAAGAGAAVDAGADAAVDAGAQLAVGQLSEDGHWQWNGTDWVAAATPADAVETEADQAAEPVGGTAAGTAAGTPSAETAEEPREWDREINDSIDDPETEAAEPPSLEATGASA